MNTNPEVPLDFKVGLGYSPNSGPPVGGWAYQPVSTFYGDNLSELLPYNRSYFGSTVGYRTKRNNCRKACKKCGRFSRDSKIVNHRSCSTNCKSCKQRSFGYPLSNQPNPNIDMKTFPDPPIGSGLTSGGEGGVWLQGMPGFVGYWGYGKSARKSKKARRKSKKVRRKSKKARRKSKKVRSRKSKKVRSRKSKTRKSKIND